MRLLRLSQGQGEMRGEGEGEGEGEPVGLAAWIANFNGLPAFLDQESADEAVCWHGIAVRRLAV